MLKELWQKEISRRQFLSATGLSAASLVLLKGYDALHGNEERAKNSPTAKVYAAEEVNKLYTSCYMCAINCGAVGVVNTDGTVKRLEPNANDPVSGGSLCAKGNAGIDQLYDEDRLKTPMRKVGDHEWEQVSWDEAFDIMYDEFTRIANDYGPETVVGLNRRGYYTSYLKGWLRAYGSPNGPLGQASICDGGKRIAQQIAAGASGLYCDFKNTKYIMLLGANQFEAPRYRLGMIDDILTAQENGAKLIVIDPRFNYTAAKADEFHPIVPGTDGLFLLSMCHVIAREGLEDAKFIAEHSDGYDAFKAEIIKSEYAPENVEAEVGIAAKDIERMAIEFAKAESAIADTSSGIIMFQSGTVADWALLNLVAMTGNMLSEGGIVKRASAKTSGPKFEVDNSKGIPQIAASLGYVKYEGGTENGNRNILADCILNPEAVPAGPRVPEATLPLYDGKGVKSLFIYNTEPIGSQLGTDRLREAFNALEFGVVVDIYLTQTAEAMPVGSLALPECTYLERYSARSANGYTPVLNINQPLVEPMWESKTGYWIFSKLGQRFGYEEFANFDPEDDLGEARKSVENADQGDGLKVNWDELVENGTWMKKDAEARDYENYAKVFPNEKYRFSFTGEDINDDHKMFLSAGGEAYPTYMKPLEVTADYPLRFMAGGKVMWHTQTSTRNNKYLMQVFDSNVIVKDKNYIVMSVEDAAERGLESGDEASIASPIRTVTSEVLVTSRMPKGFVHMTHGFGHDAPTMTIANGVGVNSSSLCDAKRTDPFSNCFTAKEEICNVSRA